LSISNKINFGNFGNDDVPINAKGSYTLPEVGDLEFEDDLDEKEEAKAED
jgi:hypothetical protein